MRTETDDMLLSCENIVKRYGALTAVDRLSLQVRAGEILGIGGPNGAGKTTLFDMISGVTKATEGRIVFKGRDITRLPPHKVSPQGLARTFQLNAAFDSLSVEENVLCSAYFGRTNILFPQLRYPPAAREAARAALSTTGLEALRDRRAGSLTILQRKQLMIACALATRPAVLLLDEPVGGLTVAEIDQTIEMIAKVRSEWPVTIILIEHVMRFLVALCDRAVIMHHGRKIYEGPISGLAGDREVVEVYLGETAARRLRNVATRQDCHA